MRALTSSLIALLVLAPTIAAGEPPTVQAVVVNAPEYPVPVQGSVVVAAMPREKGSNLFDQSVLCSGAGPSYQCDAKWDGSVIIESISAHCDAAGGSVWVLRVITSIGTAPSTPADKFSAFTGNGATAATALEGARRFLPLTSLLSLDPSHFLTTLTLHPLRALVPQDRFVRVVFQGDMVSATCIVAFSGHWID